jgi:hypothetical protein
VVPLGAGRKRAWWAAALSLSLLAGLTSAGPAQAKPSSAPAVETRCGWWIAPTPGTVWLRDRDSEWVIAMQDGYQAEGANRPAPRFGAGWVQTRGGGGHGCACVRGMVDARIKGYKRVVDFWTRPLNTCRADPAVKRLEPTS